MAGIFDIKKGAFDSSEAAVLHQAYAIALQGLRGTHKVDRPLANLLARSIVKVARTEPDCLRYDGTIDPIRLAQRAILRMLQTSAPGAGVTRPEPTPERERTPSRRQDLPVPGKAGPVPAAAESPAKVMMRLFDRTPFAKL
jgi:hypothetical protein